MYASSQEYDALLTYINTKAFRIASASIQQYFGEFQCHPIPEKGSGSYVSGAKLLCVFEGS